MSGQDSLTGSAERAGHPGDRDGAAPADEAGPRAAEPSAMVARRRMSVREVQALRRPPSELQQARRRTLLLWTKWLLPAAALLLLGSIAAWPEIERALSTGRSAVGDVRALRLVAGSMFGARYHGLDVHGRPYMITADEARQIDPDRIDLARPVADSLTQGGQWVLVRARQGVYMPHSQILDLYDHAWLYRDDGVIMHGPDVVIDVRRSAVASDDWVHAEGPFGVLDAQGYFLSQRDGLGQFRGPGRLVLNDDHVATPSHAAGSGR